MKRTFQVPGRAKLGQTAAPTPDIVAHILALRLRREMSGPQIEAPARQP